MSRAAAAYTRFHGEPPKKTIRVQLPDDDLDGYRLGKVEAIAYRAKRGGRYDSYMHEFDNGAGPNLDVTADGQQLILTDGDYHVTDHGIEDLKMPALLVVNPHKLGSKPKHKVLNMTARNSKGQFVKGRGATKTRKSNPSPPKTKVKYITRAAPVQAPAARRSSSPKIVYVNPAPVKRKRRYRHNPFRSSSSKGLMGGINLIDLGVAGLSQATGAVATSAVFAMAPIPPVWKTGPAAVLVKIAMGVSMAVLISKFGKHSAAVRNYAQNFAEGTITLAMVDWIKGALPKSVNLGIVNDEGFGLVRQIDDGMALVQNRDGSFGYVTAANVVQDSGTMSGATIYQNY